MALAPLSEQQLAEAREWAARLGVPEHVVIADAQAAKDEGYRETAAGAARRGAGWTARMASAGGGQMAPGHGPEPAEVGAEVGSFGFEAEAG